MIKRLYEWFRWNQDAQFGIGAFIAFLIIAFGLLMLTSCASVFDTHWYKVGEPIQTRFYITAPNTDATCRSIGTKSAGLISACSNRDYRQQVCTIYLPPKAPEYLIAHEEKHCDGWDHA